MWNHRPSDRLHEWKGFRERIGTLEISQAIAEVNHLWCYAPYVSYYLDPNLVDEWPDPWTLLHENYYCDLAKSLGMLYTLYLSQHYKKTISDICLKVYKNPLNHDVFNTVWVDEGKYILNLEFNTVVNKTQVDEKLVLTHSYSTEDLRLNLY